MENNTGTELTIKPVKKPQNKSLENSECFFYKIDHFPIRLYKTLICGHVFKYQSTLLQIPWACFVLLLICTLIFLTGYII